MANQNKYMFQLRRGTREVNADGSTRMKDGQPTRDDWTAYTNSSNYFPIQAGEMIIEFEKYPDGKIIPRLKIGDGISTFAELEYMSVDSFILPKQISVTLYGSEDTANADKEQWKLDDDGRYKQKVTIDGAVVTPNDKIDLNPTPEQLAMFHNKDVSFVAENEDGEVTVYCIGQKPKNTYAQIPVTITKVMCNNGGNSDV